MRGENCLALYEYCAIHSKTGKRISEKTEIADLTLFLREMHRQGYIVTSVKKAGSFWRRLSFLRPKRAISKSDKGMAMLELSAFLKAGIPLKQSLEQMAQESPRAVSQVLRAAALDLEQGVSFHKAISACEDFFDEWEIQAIKAAEVSGSLAESLEYIGGQTLKSYDFDKKVSSATVYPIMVSAVTVLLAFILVVFVVPAFAGMLGEEDLPGATKALVAISDFVRNYWFALLGFILGGRLFLKHLVAERGNSTSEQLALLIPGWRKVREYACLVRFGKTLATLLESGVRVLPALEYAGQATGSSLFAERTTYIRKEVEKGARIGDSMRKSGVFPILFCELTAAGEASGTLPEMAVKAARFYEGEVNRRLDLLSSMVEPVLVLIVGIAVGFLGYTVMGPILRSLELLM